MTHAQAIHKIANFLEGIDLEDMTTAERQIWSLLETEGFI